MTFLAMSIQKSYLKQQKAQYQFDEIVYTNFINELNDELQEVTSEEDYDEDEAYYLEEELEWYTLQMDHCNLMIENIGEQLESYNDTIKDEIKHGCSFKISGRG